MAHASSVVACADNDEKHYWGSRVCTKFGMAAIGRCCFTLLTNSVAIMTSDSELTPV